MPNKVAVRLGLADFKTKVGEFDDHSARLQRLENDAATAQRVVDSKAAELKKVNEAVSIEFAETETRKLRAAAKQRVESDVLSKVRALEAEVEAQRPYYERDAVMRRARALDPDTSKPTRDGALDTSLKSLHQQQASKATPFQLAEMARAAAGERDVAKLAIVLDEIRRRPSEGPVPDIRKEINGLADKMDLPEAIEGQRLLEDATIKAAELRLRAQVLATGRGDPTDKIALGLAKRARAEREASNA